MASVFDYDYFESQEFEDIVKVSSELDGWFRANYSHLYYDHLNLTPGRFFALQTQLIQHDTHESQWMKTHGCWSSPIEMVTYILFDPTGNIGLNDWQDLVPLLTEHQDQKPVFICTNDTPDLELKRKLYSGLRIVTEEEFVKYHRGKYKPNSNYW